MKADFANSRNAAPFDGDEAGPGAPDADRLPRRLVRMLWPAWLAIGLLVALNLLVLKVDDVQQVALVSSNQWSRAYKQATVHLLRHVETGEQSDLDPFREVMQLRQTTRDARMALTDPTLDQESAARRLMRSYTSLEDARARIWFVRLFGELAEFRAARAHVQQADRLLADLEGLAQESVRLHRSPGQRPTELQRAALSLKVMQVDAAIAVEVESLAAAVLAGARRIRAFELYANLAIASVLLALCTFLFSRTLRQMLRAKAELRLANHRFALATQAANEAVWEWDLASRLEVTPPKLVALLGITPTVVLGRQALRKSVHPLDRDVLLRTIGRHLYADLGRLDFQVRLRLAAGGYRWFRIRGQAQILSEKGDVRMLGTVTDVHDQVVAEMAREQAERERTLAAEKLEMALDAAHIALCEYDPSTGLINQTRRWEGLLGYSVMPPTMQAWEELVHPGDRRRRAELLARHLANQTPYFECEYRMRHASGRWVWVRGRGRVTLRALDGNPLAYAGAVMDLSAEVAARELRLRQHEFLQAMIEGIDTGILLSDADHITYVNASLGRMMGRTDKSVLVGQPLTAIGATATAGEQLRAARVAAGSGEVVPVYVVELCGGQGAPVPMIAAISHLEWEGRSQFIHTFTPVDEFEGIEQKLKSAQTRFERSLVAQLELQQSHIARELQDSLGPVLAGLKMLLEAARHAAADGADVGDLLEHCQAQLGEAVDSAQALARGIAPATDSGESLVELLERLVMDLCELKGIEAGLHLQAGFDEMPPEAANHVYRIVQEAAGNALRHGNATCIDISLVPTPQGIALSIEDNGCGWPAGTPVDPDGMGLRSMRARAEILDARLQFGTAANGGVRVTLVLPSRTPAFGGGEGLPHPVAQAA